MKHRQRVGFSLVEILVVMVILVLLAAFLLPRYLSSSKTASGKTIQSPIQRGRSVECLNNLQQIRAAYQLRRTTEDEAPASLADLRQQGITTSMMACPESRQPYTFDPATGNAKCVTPGHEGLLPSY